MCTLFPIFLPGEAVLIANGISKSVLLSYTKDTQYFHPLKEISTGTNGIILELVKLKYENSSVTFAIFYQWIKDLYGDLWPQPDSPTTQAVSRSVLRLKAQFEKLKKLRSCEEKEEKVQAFLLEEFTLPTLGFRKGKVVSFSSVLRNIAHKSATRLPSYGLTCQMILESLTVVQAQLGDCLSEASGFMTLQTDGTTKFGDHYATYDVRTDSFSYSLGLCHVFSGSSMDTLETLKEILDDIDSVQLSLGHQAVSSKIVSKIKNTMSDRHAAEKLFNEVLHDFREEILPNVVENWEDLTKTEKQQMTRMNNFFCGLHYLVGLAECTDKALSMWEFSLLSDNAASPPSSSSTQRLVRTACKAFHHRGSQQCGTSTLFRSYLKEQGIFKIPLAQFVGNRFNILFYDAAGVYYLHDYMIKFIESVHGKNANRLLQSVLKDLKTLALIAGCRALGLIDKIITGPLWRKLEESSISVLEMGFTYCERKDKLDLWSSDSSSLLDGTARCIEGFDIHSDEVWDTLIQSNSTDKMTLELLQLLCNTFSVTTQRLLIDHLPNGIYYNVTNEELIRETASVS